MFSEFLNIIIKSIKLDKSLYNENKNYSEASIYFAIVIIILTAIIGIVPGSAMLDFFSSTFNVNDLQGPSLRSVIITSLIVWIVKAVYLYFVGAVLFPSKNTKSTFRKILITVSYAHAPLILNVFIWDYRMLYFMFIPYIWYNISLIVGINENLKYKNYFKSTLVVTAPIIFLLIFTLMQLSNFQMGTIS